MKGNKKVVCLVKEKSLPLWYVIGGKEKDKKYHTLLNINKKDNEKKKKITIWIHPETLKMKS